MNSINIIPILTSQNFQIINPINNSLQFYKKETYHHIKKNLGYYLAKILKIQIKYIIYKILSNEDLYADIMTAIMLADATWDKNKSSKNYWRNQHCLWAINTIIRKNKIKYTNIGCFFKQEKTPIDYLIDKEEKDRQLKKIDTMDKRTKEIINLYYIDNLSEQAISSMYSISQQRISQIIYHAKQQFQRI